MAFALQIAKIERYSSGPAYIGLGLWLCNCTRERSNL